MTDVEKRRLKLLQETRNTYNEKFAPPAIHPRYQAAYHSIYGNEQIETNTSRNSFFVRLVISVMIFTMFYVMDYRQEKIGHINSQQIINAVQMDLLGENFPFLVK